MKYLLLKAQAKKKKWIKQNKEIDDDSDGDLTSDDEEEISKDIVYRCFNNRYLCIKYLGRGTFSRVWMVYDIINYKYYAMKMIFP